jgi:acyl-CoA thioester hydrolase
MTIPDSSPPAPQQGRIEGSAFLFPVRVYYEDTDFSGVVYHANYLKFMERGRSEFLRMAGVRHRGLLTAEEPLVWVVRRMDVEFLRPARVDDALLVRTRVRGLGGARMMLEQSVERGAETLIKAAVEVCVVTLDGKPRRMPDAVRESLAAFL